MESDQIKRADLLLPGAKLLSHELLERIRAKHGLDNLTDCFDYVTWKMGLKDLEPWEIDQAFNEAGYNNGNKARPNKNDGPKSGPG